MPYITKLRAVCTTHNKVLIVCGHDRIFSPTHTTLTHDGLDDKKDSAGWWHLDASELICPVRHDELMTAGADVAAVPECTCDYQFEAV